MRATVVALTVTVAAMVLAGCGGDDDDGGQVEVPGTGQDGGAGVPAGDELVGEVADGGHCVGVSLTLELHQRLSERGGDELEQAVDDYVRVMEAVADGAGEDGFDAGHRRMAEVVDDHRDDVVTADDPGVRVGELEEQVLADGYDEGYSAWSSYCLGADDDEADEAPPAHGPIDAELASQRRSELGGRAPAEAVELAADDWLARSAERVAELGDDGGEGAACPLVSGPGGDAVASFADQAGHDWPLDSRVRWYADADGAVDVECGWLDAHGRVVVAASLTLPAAGQRVDADAADELELPGAVSANREATVSEDGYADVVVLDGAGEVVASDVGQVWWGEYRGDAVGVQRAAALLRSSAAESMGVVEFVVSEDVAAFGADEGVVMAVELLSGMLEHDLSPQPAG